MNVRVTLYQNLAEMLDAGVPILRALKTVRAGVRGRWNKALQRMVDAISGGSGFAEAMAEYPRLFKRLDIMVAETGELSGNLPKALKLLSEWYRLTDAMKAMMRSGLILPGLYIHFAALIFLFVDQVRDSGIMDFDGQVFLYSYLRTIIACFWGPILVILIILKLTPSLGIIRRIFDAITLAIPLLGGGLRYMAISRYCRAFHLFISAGVNGVESARKACEVTGNAEVASWFKGAAASAKAGNPFSEGLSKRLPLMFREQWVVGEETGRLDEVARRLADSHQESGERRLKEFARWLPRLIYFIIVIAIAYLIVSFWKAYYSSAMSYM